MKLIRHRSPTPSGPRAVGQRTSEQYVAGRNCCDGSLILRGQFVGRLTVADSRTRAQSDVWLAKSTSGAFSGSERYLGLVEVPLFSRREQRYNNRTLTMFYVT